MEGDIGLSERLLDEVLGVAGVLGHAQRRRVELSKIRTYLLLEVGLIACRSHRGGHRVLRIVADEHHPRWPPTTGQACQPNSISRPGHDPPKSRRSGGVCVALVWRLRVRSRS